MAAAHGDTAVRHIVDDVMHLGDDMEYVDCRTLMERSRGWTVKVGRTDNRGEFLNRQMETLMRKHNIRHEKTVAHVHETAGSIEREHQTIFKGIRACHGQ